MVVQPGFCIFYVYNLGTVQARQRNPSSLWLKTGPTVYVVIQRYMTEQAPRTFSSSIIRFCPRSVLACRRFASEPGAYSGAAYLLSGKLRTLLPVYHQESMQWLGRRMLSLTSVISESRSRGRLQGGGVGTKRGRLAGCGEAAGQPRFLMLGAWVRVAFATVDLDAPAAPDNVDYRRSRDGV